MATSGGYIKIHRKILNWEWYSDINTFRLFMHLLLKANFKDAKFEGKKILRGQLVTSLTSLATQTGLTVHQVRVSLDKLKTTGEVANASYTKYRVITIVRYDDYQIDDKQDGRQMAVNVANKRQTNDKQMADKWQTNGKQVATIEEEKERKEEKEGNNEKREGTASRFIAPTLDEVQAYCRERGNGIDAQHFIDYYEARGWELKPRQKMKDWKAAVRTWEQNEKKKPAAVPAKQVVAQQYTQRDYSQPAETSSYDDFLDRLDQLMK